MIKRMIEKLSDEKITTNLFCIGMTICAGLFIFSLMKKDPAVVSTKSIVCSECLCQKDR